MKKILLCSFLATTIILSNAVITTAKPCPIHSECKKSAKAEKQATHYSPCRFMSEEQKKVIEEKKEEFKKRLNITEEQKAELEKIKAHEQKVLMPYKKKIEKEEAKLKELFLQEHEIRVKHSQQFEALLTPEQKAELQKFRTETIKEMMKFAPPTNMFNTEDKVSSPKAEESNAIKQDENANNANDNKSEVNCTCKQKELKENNIEFKNTEVKDEPIPEANTENEEQNKLKIKGTSENVLKEASTEDFNANEKNISKFVKENTSNEEVEAVAPNEELQPKSLERKVIEPTVAPTPTAPTIQEEITLEK